MEKKHVRNFISTLIILMMITSVIGLPAVNDDNSVQAKSKKVKVTYKANGGKFTAKKYASKKSFSKSIVKGKKIGKLPKIKRKGYTFKGWYSKKTGGKKISKTTKITKKTVLYARWSKNSASNNANTAITVKLDAGSGTCTKTEVKVELGKPYGSIPDAVSYTTISQPYPKPDRKMYYTFLGWYSEPDGKGEKITAETIVTKNYMHTLYAKFSRIAY